MILFESLDTGSLKRCCGGMLAALFIHPGPVNAATLRFPVLYEMTLEELLHVRVMDFFQRTSSLIELPLEALLDMRAVDGARRRP